MISPVRMSGSSMSRQSFCAIFSAVAFWFMRCYSAWFLTKVKFTRSSLSTRLQAVGCLPQSFNTALVFFLGLRFFSKLVLTFSSSIDLSLSLAASDSDSLSIDSSDSSVCSFLASACCFIYWPSSSFIRTSYFSFLMIVLSGKMSLRRLYLIRMIISKAMLTFDLIRAFPLTWIQ
jgi:hypothetical protein